MVHQIYAGKAKEMWTTEDEDVLRVVYLDQATALNGKKKDHINDKGKTNNAISTLIFKYFEANGIKTHFIKKISDAEELVKKVKIIPLEMITRNYSAGHFASRYGVEEGKNLQPQLKRCALKAMSLMILQSTPLKQLPLELLLKHNWIPCGQFHGKLINC